MPKPIFFLAALGLGTAVFSAPAAFSLDRAPMGTQHVRSVAFKDLPGVQPERRAVPMDDVVCTSAVEEDDDPFPSSRPFARSKVIYKCTRGDTTFESDRAPYPAERRYRGLNW